MRCAQGMIKRNRLVSISMQVLESEFNLIEMELVIRKSNFKTADLQPAIHIALLMIKLDEFIFRQVQLKSDGSMPNYGNKFVCNALVSIIPIRLLYFKFIYRY